MLASLRAEIIKVRRLRFPVLGVLAGSGLVALAWTSVRAALTQFARERAPEMPWQDRVVGDVAVLLVLILPTLVTLVTALAFHVEHRNGMWKQLRATPRSMASVYAAKFLVVQSVVALALLAALSAAMVGWPLLPDPLRRYVPVTDADVTSVLWGLSWRLYLSLLPVALVQFVLSARLPNVLYPVGIGVVLSTASLLLSGPANAAWFPYAYARVVLAARFPPSPDRGGDQRPDLAFRPPAAAFGPAADGGKAILVDEAHQNRHRLGTSAVPGTLHWIAPPAGEAHLPVRVARTSESSEMLADVGLLIVAGCTTKVSREETAVILEWVRTGGSLLLLTDHPPYDTPAEELARALSIGFTRETVVDPGAGDPRAPGASRLVFTRADGGILAHPVTAGVERVITYGGQGIWRDGDTQPLLALSSRARTSAGRPLPGTPPAQLLAFIWGAGRVIVSGETALFTAQEKTDGQRVGVADAGTDNARLAIQAMRWLLRVPNAHPSLSF